MADAQPPLDPESFLPPVPAWSGASEALIAAPGDPWITPSEVTGLTETPNYVETVAFLKKMDDMWQPPNGASSARSAST